MCIYRQSEQILREKWHYVHASMTLYAALALCFLLKHRIFLCRGSLQTKALKCPSMCLPHPPQLPPPTPRTLSLEPLQSSAQSLTGGCWLKPSVSTLLFNKSHLTPLLVWHIKSPKQRPDKLGKPQSLTTGWEHDTHKQTSPRPTAATLKTAPWAPQISLCLFFFK